MKIYKYLLVNLYKNLNLYELMADTVSHPNIFVTDKLEYMKNKIENMSKNHQIEILKILKKNSTAKINENKSGIFINLSLLSTSVLEEIDFYLNYVHDQENSLQHLESQKKEFKDAFFMTESD